MPRGQGPPPPEAAPGTESRISQRRRTAKTEGGEDFVRRRQAVLDAAVAVFAEVGYDTANFADIGERAGMNRATVYYYFASKEELLREVLHDTIAANLANIRRIRRRRVPADVKLRDAIEEMMSAYARHYPTLYIYFEAEGARLQRQGDPRTKEMLELASQYVEEMIAIVGDGMRAKVLRPVGPPEVVGMAVVGMVNWTYRWWRPERGHTGAELGRVFADLALFGLRTDPLP